MSGIKGFLFLLSGMFVLLIIVGVFWSIRSGQFDDLEGPAERIRQIEARALQKMRALIPA
jgi:cbb3-type cytochrome oxidase maturation protein